MSCSILELFAAVVDRADYRKVIIAMALGFFVAVNRQITVCSGASCCMVIDLSLVRRLFFVPGFLFRAFAVLLL